ncbi:apolipoprotein N-acyltransferase [Aquamicrobium segne]|uniref:Apolipoprotein N-acyltransferase n=1 Tax=Aquamicrobium segne TaxID=469547 RepID=A0ABW0GU08_9HYPH
MQRLADQIVLLWGWRRALVAFLAGAFATLALAPYDFIAACFVSFPVLVWLLDGATGDGAGSRFGPLKPAFAIGWWFGFGYFLGGLWWIGTALLVEAENFAWALPFAMVGIPLLLAFFYGLATAFARLLWSSGIGRVVALALGFGLAEGLRGFVLTGFPWNAIGYAAMPIPLLMQSVSVVGMEGMNMLAVLAFALPAVIIDHSSRRFGGVLLAVLVSAHLGFGYYQLTQARPQTNDFIGVRIVQPNIDLSEKWDGQVRERIFASLLELSSRAPAAGEEKPQLIIWPETSVPFLFTDRPDALSAIGQMLEEGQLLIAGAVREEAAAGQAGRPRYYNSVIAIDDRGEIVDAVDKVHLVPFGEYIPFADLFASFGVEQLVAGPMNFEAGAFRKNIALPNGTKITPFICYEVIFPALVAHDSNAAALMVNVTNDAWFGNTAGPYQHFRQAQIRSVENGKPLLRAANTGISGVIEQRGEVVDALAVNMAGIIDARLPLYHMETINDRARRIIGVILWFVLAVAMVVVNVRRGLRMS